MNEKKYLIDIKSAIDRIDIHIKGILSITDYRNNVTVKSAVERELEIIGEAMKCLLLINPAIELTSPQKIIAMRNRIIHGYQNIDDILIFQVVKDNIPLLKSEVENSLKE